MQRFIFSVIALSVAVLLNAQIVSLSSPEIEPTPDLTDGAVSGYRHGDSGLLIMPTAYTLPKGMFQASTWWFGVYTLGYGVTEDIQLNFSSVFPFEKELLDGITGSAKYGLHQSEKVDISSWLTLTPLLDLVSTGVVGSSDLGRVRLHGGVGLGVDYVQSEYLDVWMGGADFQMGKRRLLYFETISTTKSVFNELSNLIILGVRFYRQDFSYEGALVRVFEDSNKDSDWWWFPMLKFSLTFY